MTQLFDALAASEPEKPLRYAHVALEQGIDASATGLTYAIPASLEDIQIGDRVIVPLGKNDHRVNGYVVELADRSDYAHVKEIISRDPKGVSLPSDLIELAKWIASYYCCPLGMVFATMLPAAVKRGVGMVTQMWVRVKERDQASEPASQQGEEAETKPQASRLTKLQAHVLDTARDLANQGELWVEMKRLADRAGARSLTPVRQLVAKGQLEFKQTRQVQADWSQNPQRIDNPPEGMKLNESQTRAVERLAQSVHRGFSVHLLHGVTGSGKTEVYLRAIEHLLATPSPQRPGPVGAIVLVPEIALTPQTVARFIGRFESVAVLHSGLTAAQRHEQWRRIRQGQARIVVGARSAIFAPMPNIGVIIVDEEHEQSYKQDQLPRYHARDVAVKRGQILGIPVVLGSATPSLESYYNATVARAPQEGARAKGQGPRGEGQGASEAGVPETRHGDSDPRHPKPDTRTPLSEPRYHLLKLPDRVAGLRLPAVEIIDMVEERRQRKGIHLLSQRLESALRSVVEAKGQAILLLNRRGYANYIACPDHRCGWLMSCDFCDATMVYHRDSQLPAGGLVRCHHCDAEQLLPQVCPACGRKASVFGLGTQRVEEELGKKFPGLKFLRMDSDAMRTGRDYDRSLESFRHGEVDVLVGTQMIAKGLDFPNVRLVGVISADTSLHMPDFRASERTFQLIAQVAGRAGRGEHLGTVIVQSFNPNDAAITLASQHDYPAFAQREIALRREVGLPPHARMARIVVRDQDHVACDELVKTLADQLEALNRQQGSAVRLRGPMPCPIARIAGFHRQQIELIAPDASTMQRLLTAARNARALKSDARTAVDVDPVALL